MKKLFSFLSRFYQSYSATVPLDARHLEQGFDSPDPTNLGDAAQPITLIRTGLGNYHIVQGLALDHQNNFLYTTHVEGHPEQGVINRFKLNSSNLWSAQDAQKPSPLVGHQGICVDPHSDFMFASAGSGIPNKGWYILKFKYMPNAEPMNTQVIQVFDKRYNKITNTMPAITPDGKYLLVRGNNHKSNLIRIFKLDLITQKKLTDLCFLYEDEWPIDAGLTQDRCAFQGLSTDGTYIYLLSGNKNKGPKRIYVYDFAGKLLQKMDSVTLGHFETSSSHAIQYWEPEGLTVDSQNQQLYVLYSIGNSGQFLGRIYRMKINT
jgi:DNA-binding beta-propeller fold protein YncE